MRTGCKSLSLCNQFRMKLAHSDWQILCECREFVSLFTSPFVPNLQIFTHTYLSEYIYMLMEKSWFQLVQIRYLEAAQKLLAFLLKSQWCRRKEKSIQYPRLWFQTVGCSTWEGHAILWGLYSACNVIVALAPFSLWVLQLFYMGFESQKPDVLPCI